jgi:hypothetical protein
MDTDDDGTVTVIYVTVIPIDGHVVACDHVVHYLFIQVLILLLLYDRTLVVLNDIGVEIKMGSGEGLNAHLFTQSRRIIDCVIIMSCLK